MHHETRQIHRSRAPECQGYHQKQNVGQNTKSTHTPNPRIVIKNPDTSGNRTQGVGLEAEIQQPRHRERQVLYRVFENFYYRILGLVEGTE